MNVEPVIHEVGRYYVQSETHADQRHLCDILESSCGCAAWTCRQRKHKAATGKPYLCKHLKAARLYAFNDYLEVMREVALSR